MVTRWGYSCGALARRALNALSHLDVSRRWRVPSGRVWFPFGFNVCVFGNARIHAHETSPQAAIVHIKNVQ
jgi:hypothetical protein